MADEEDASIGSEAVIAALPGLGIQPDVCLIAEPTGLALARSLRGFALVRVGFTGRAAHSSQPSLGVNAVSRLARLVVAVDERAAGVREGGGDLMVTLASGGDSAFVVPDRAGASWSLEPPRRVGRRRAGRGAGPAHPDLGATAALEADRAPGASTRPAPRPSCPTPWRRLGTRVDFDAPYWMEAPLWQAACPTVICGPTGGGMHAIDEWVDLVQVRAFARALIEVLPAWAGDSTAPCRLTRAACAATLPCSTPGCASTNSRRRRSRSPATSNDTTWSETSWPATCRCTPGSTR